MIKAAYQRRHLIEGLAHSVRELVHDCYGRDKDGRSSSSGLTSDKQVAGRERKRERE